MRLRTVGVVLAVAAVVATGAFGGSSSGTITTIAGTGTSGFSGDGGPATAAKLSAPWGVAIDGQGNVYIADERNWRVRKITPGGTISTFAGTGAAGYSGDGGLATSAQLNSAKGVAVDGQGSVYIADSYNYRVRKIGRGGAITTFAGGGKPGFLGDGGPATSATVRNPFGVAVDGQGNVYIADTDNMRVRKVNPSGTITTIAGTGVQGFSGDGGRATSARLRFPYGVAVDGRQNVYIADNGNNRVRKVSPGGTITTFAGTGACGSLLGDGGPATSATVCQPMGLAVDGQGNVYIAGANVVRKVSPGGKITTFAGTGTCGSVVGNGGQATRAQLCYPSGMAVDGQGDLYIAEQARGRVRKVGTSTAKATYAGFYSPSHNLSCELADRDSRGSYVYCQSVKAPKNVRMGLDGRLKICRGTQCLGNPAENTPALGYGKKITIGRFGCLSQQSGVRCTVIRSRKGFLIDSKSVRRVGP